jgi:hypothetical protein
MDALGMQGLWARPVLITGAVLSWFLAPLVLGTLCAADRAGRLPPREALVAYLRHPFATAFTMLALPIGLLLVESLIVGAAWQQTWLGVFIDDFVPLEHTDHIEFSSRIFRIIDTVNTPDTYFLDVYRRALGYGYTFIGAITSSLPRGIHTRLSPGQLMVRPLVYLAVRALFSFLAFLGAGIVLAVQARWLGAIPSVESLRGLRNRVLGSGARVS